MRKHAVVFVAILLLAAFGCAKKANVEEERAAIRAADTGWSTAIGTKNADEFMKYVAADATMLPPNNPAVTGTDAIHAWVSEMMANPVFSVSWEPTTIEVASSGDMGYTIGAYQAQMPMPDGTSTTDHGKYVSVWKKQADGSWKVVADIFNSDLPMPMPAASSTDTTAVEQ